MLYIKRIIIGAIVSVAAAAHAETINLATGLDSSGNVLSAGDELDANWTITNASSYLDAPNAYSVFPYDADWYGGWFADGPNSDWIAADPDTSYNGNMIASRSFDLTASQLAGASFSGTQFAIDDSGTLYVNGNYVASVGDGQWGSFTSLTIPTADLIAGTNTITMYDYSDYYLEAFRFEGTLNVSNVSSAPGPFSAIPMALGLTGLALRRKFRRS